MHSNELILQSQNICLSFKYDSSILYFYKSITNLKPRKNNQNNINSRNKNVVDSTYVIDKVICFNTAVVFF